MSPLNGSEPFALDVADLGRRAGAMLEVSRVSPAPADLNNPVIGVPEGSAVQLELMAESVIEGVLVSGRVTVTIAGSCGRCLDPVDDTLTVEVQELFRYEDLDHAQDDDDEELPVLIGDIVDLEATIRDVVLLALPSTPLCDQECVGLCSECGARLSDDPAHRHDRTDPRWAALAGVLAQDGSTQN